MLVYEQRHFLRFHNAVNSGRTCIYLEKLFKNDVLRPMWSYLKDTVYRSNPRDLKQLKMNITRAIEEVNERTLEKLRGTW